MNTTANTAEVLVDDEGFALVSSEDVLLDAQIGHLLGIDAEIEKLQDRRDALAGLIIESVQAKPDAKYDAGIAKLAVVEAVTTTCPDLDVLQESVSRRLFARLTRRSFDVKAYHALVAAGTYGIEKALPALKERTSKPSLRITKR